MLLRKFGAASENVKIILFKSFCTQIYCGSLWCNFKRSSIKMSELLIITVFVCCLNSRNIVVLLKCLWKGESQLSMLHYVNVKIVLCTASGIPVMK